MGSKTTFDKGVDQVELYNIVRTLSGKFVPVQVWITYVYTSTITG